MDSSNKVGDASAAQIASDKADDAGGEAEAAQLRMLACYGLGGALVGLGLYMLATDGAPEPSPSSEGTSWVPTLSISDDHVGLGAHLRFCF